MFKQSYNRALVDFRLETLSPLLIKAGDSGLDPTAADLTCVRTRHALHGLTVYIPGSSLKGVLRSVIEASLRGRTSPRIPAVCDPLQQDNTCHRSQGQADRPTSSAVYKQQCPVCRMFGSQRLRGRAAVRDLFPWDPGASANPKMVAGGDNHRSANHLEHRPGVAIDRLSGAVRHGPWDQELVPAGVSFFGEVALENYQVWQLGLLVEGFERISDGLARLGSSKSRGLGRARVEITQIVHEQGAHLDNLPRGLADLGTSTLRNDYGLLPEQPLPATPSEARGLHRRFRADGTHLVAWLDAGRSALGVLT